MIPSASHPNFAHIASPKLKVNLAKLSITPLHEKKKKANTLSVSSKLSLVKYNVCLGKLRGSGSLELSVAFAWVWAWPHLPKSLELTSLRLKILSLLSNGGECLQYKIRKEYLWTMHSSCIDPSLELRTDDSSTFCCSPNHVLLQEPTSFGRILQLELDRSLKQR